MTTLSHAGLTLLILLLFAGVYTTIFSLPGTLFIAGVVFLYALLTGFHSIGFGTLAMLIVMTVVAESAGFFLEMKSNIRFGLSLKGIFASLAGSLLGIMVLTPFLWGLGTVLGIFLGGFIGLFTLEMVGQYNMKPAFRTPAKAIATTTAGILIKGFFAVAMTALTMVSIYS